MSSRLNTADALHFLDNLKLQFRNDPTRYSEFLDAMKDFKRHRITNTEVVVRVCEVLNGYPTLVKEFNSFLPNGYTLEPSSHTDGRESFITLNTPEGVSVYPRDYPLQGQSVPLPRPRKTYYDI